MLQTYQQLVLDEEFHKYVVINIHRGLFHYNRLPFGVFSAPVIFQWVMESSFSGISAMVVYLDDILVTGSSEHKHLETLEEILRRLGQTGLHLRRDRCIFLASSVVYLGHKKINSQWLHSIFDKSASCAGNSTT